MKRKYTVHTGKGIIEREYNYVPIRYIIAFMLTLLEIVAIIGMVVLCCYYIPYFYIAAWITQIFCVINIIASNDNPDYKVPWLLFVLILPIAGFMLYFLFYSRKLEKRFIRRLSDLKRYAYANQNTKILAELEEENPHAAAQAKMLCRISEASVFKNTRQTYYPLGEDLWHAMLSDLEQAKRFIFLEYFIIEEGEFWSSILDVLKRKAAEGVTVRVL